MIILSINNSADIYGASRCLARILSQFVAHGHYVHVVLPSDGPLKALLEENGIHVYVQPRLAVIDRSNFASLSKKLLFVSHYLYSVAWLTRLIWRTKARVIHTNSAVLAAPALAAKLLGRKHLWHVRELFTEFPSFWSIYQHYLAHMSFRVITVSDAVEKQFAPQLQYKCVTIYDGLEQDAMCVDNAAAAALRRSFGNPLMLIGVVGRIKWIRKGQEVLVKAAALLRHRCPDAQYVIVGGVASGNEEHLVNLHRLVRETGMDDRIIFAGEFSNMRDVYASFDVTVVPSVQPEPFGCVVVESMAAGTPVVGSRCGGIVEQIVDGETGLLFEPGNEQALAESLQMLITNTELRSMMSLSGQQRFAEFFRIEQTYQQTAGLFGIKEDEPCAHTTSKHQS